MYEVLYYNYNYDSVGNTWNVSDNCEYEMEATLLIPHAVDVNFTFKKDTLYMTAETSGEVGTNFFIQRNDTLMIRKISGSSPCPVQAQGMYRIEWFENGNKFRLHGISDECEGRIGVFYLESV